MKHSCLFVFFLVVSLDGLSSELFIDWKELLKPGLEKYELQIDDFMINPNHIQFSGSVEVSPFHQLLIETPFDNHHVIHNLTNYLVEYPTQYMGGYLLNLSILLDQRVHHDVINEWNEEIPTIEQLEKLIYDLAELNNKSINEQVLNQWHEKYADFPDVIKQTLYEFFLTLKKSYAWLKLNEEAAQITDQLPRLYTNTTHSPALLQKEEQFQEQFDLRYLLLASVEMSQFLANLLDRQNEINEVDFQNDVELATPLGSIHLSGSADSTHQFDSAPLLLLDIAGDDSYQDHYSQANLMLPFSLTVDFSGNDQYHSNAESYGAGSAQAGFAAMIDLGEGDDRYDGENECFGYSYSGVSIVMNASGTTSYQTKTKSLGMAERGIALSIDSDGDDTYESINYSQGCGLYVGAGCLIDLGGNDQYIASATPVIFPSAQLPDQNMSASQGFGSGRYVYSNGFSAPGGVGLLVDKEGDDIYQASVFAQGAGYGFGVGVLSDLQGDDNYQTSWYGQGSAAHKACGILLDMQGDDQIEASHYMTGGAGTDLSLGAFYNFDGNDHYTALNASFGYSIDNSFALFYDQEGDDFYEVKNQLGYGAPVNNLDKTIREVWPTFSIFIDQYGKDDYVLKETGNNSHWLHLKDDKKEKLYGIGIDLESD